MSFVCYFGGAVVGGGGCVGTCDVCVMDGVRIYGVVLFVSFFFLFGLFSFVSCGIPIMRKRLTLRKAYYYTYEYPKHRLI